MTTGRELKKRMAAPLMQPRGEMECSVPRTCAAAPSSDAADGTHSTTNDTKLRRQVRSLVVVVEWGLVAHSLLPGRCAKYSYELQLGQLSKE